MKQDLLLSMPPAQAEEPCEAQVLTEELLKEEPVADDHQRSQKQSSGSASESHLLQTDKDEQGPDAVVA